jgi:hypothetical protein
LTSLSIERAGKGSSLSAVPTLALLKSVTCRATVHCCSAPARAVLLPSGTVSMSHRSARGPPRPSHCLGLRGVAWKFVWAPPVGGVKIGAQNVPPPRACSLCGNSRLFHTFFTPFFTPCVFVFVKPCLNKFHAAPALRSTQRTPSHGLGPRAVAGASPRGAFAPRVPTPAPPI